MDYKNIMSELDDKQIEELAKYAPQCTGQSLENIKSMFRSKINVKRKPAKKKRLFIALIAAAFLLLTGFVYAGIVDLSKIYEPAFRGDAEYVSRYGAIINGGNIDDGIQLSLLSAIKDEDKMLVFFSLTDTEGDRLSDSVDLYDSWSLDQGYGGNCRLLSYDAGTKTASFVITSVGASTNKAATLTVKSFLTSRESKIGLKEGGIIGGALLSEAGTETIAFAEISKDGYGAGISPDSRYNDDKLMDSLSLLKQDRLAIEFSSIDWSVVSNIGFIDGELHIQTKQGANTFSSIMGTYFVDENDNTVFKSELSITYGKGAKISDIGYSEFIFEGINEISQLQGLRLVLDVVEYGDYYTGNWSASFKVPPQAGKITLSVPDTLLLVNEQVKPDSITLSPFGLTFQYVTDNPAPMGENTDKAFVTYNDGTVVNLQSISRGVNERNCTYTFSDPIIEIERVISVNINGREIIADKQ